MDVHIVVENPKVRNITFSNFTKEAKNVIKYCYANRNNVISFNTRHKYTLTNTANMFQVNQQQQA